MKNILNLIALLISISLFSQTEFTSIWNTTNIGTGSSANNEIAIPTNPSYTYNYTVDWGDGNTNTNVTGDITHPYFTEGTYTITISGNFPSIYFNNSGDKLKIEEILSWGTIEWLTMEDAFHGCENLNFDAIDSPDLSKVTTLKNMFRNCQSFNGIVNNWDTSTITNISGIFYNAETFNRPLANWNTAAVTDMSFAFFNAELFNEPLDNWNTTSVTTMESLFQNAEDFNQNINNWNVSKVTNMISTFNRARAFNEPLNSWDVSKVTNMSNMFTSTAFDHPINNWIVDNVTDMSGMFNRGRFNQPLDNWNLTKVTTIAAMFASNTPFNQPINNWDVSNVTDMSNTFGSAGSLKDFNQPLDLWDVSKVTNMRGMFESSTFNQPINSWDVSKVTDMSKMFSGWASVYFTAFNQPLDQWDVSKVTNMSDMFADSNFNQNIEPWDISSVTNLSSMFDNALNFNQPLNNWLVDGVTNMSAMFSKSKMFNQSLNNWNTSMVTNMQSMFLDVTTFNQNLASWNISNVTNMSNMLSNSGLSEENYDNTLIGWAIQPVKSNVNLGATSLKYCDGRLARLNLIDNYNWNITGDIVNCTNVFCTTITNPVAGDTNVPANSNIRWLAAPNATGYFIDLEVERGGIRNFVDINGSPANNYDVGNVQILTFTNEFIPGDTIFITVTPYNIEGPAVGCEELSFTVVPSWVNSLDAYKITIDTRLGSAAGLDQYNFRLQRNSTLSYNYSVDWGDNEYNNNVTSDITHVYNIPGIYTIAIIGDFPAPYFYYNGDSDEVISIDQWGTHEYQSMQRACFNCENMEYNATDVPKLSQVTDMSEMFRDAKKFDGNINNWDVSNVTNMSSTFYGNTIFNQPLNNWDVSKVTNMSSMFYRTREFDQPLNSWITDEVTNMASMFFDAEVFNKPLDNWNVSKVTSMSRMFSSTDEFNQNINSWDVSNVTSMSNMFNYAKLYNQPLNNWTVDKVTTMESMFNNAEVFDQPLNSWNVDKVTTMESMFNNAKVFNQLINSWSVSRVTTMASMFNKALLFNKPLNNWNVDSVVNMSSMFEEAEVFNQPLNNWNVSAVANMSSMFEGALLFDQSLNSWNVSSVTLMPYMFKDAAVFNSPINNWNVASVTNMEAMFSGALAFNKQIENWNTGEVLTMKEMFLNASAFNQPIDSWDVSFVQTMESMFEDAINYNQTMDSWNVASVTTMEKMFKGATTFNEVIDSWNVRAVTTMEEMFYNATAFDKTTNSWRVSGVSNMDAMFRNASSFNQSLDRWDIGTTSMRYMFSNATALNQEFSTWDVSRVNNMQNMLDNSGLTRENYDTTLIAWSKLTLTPGINLGAVSLLYCDALEERQSIIDTYGWTFSGDILDCPIPICTQLISPLNGDIDIPVNTNLSWEPALYARGYRLTVVTQPGNVLVVDNETINNETSYEFLSDFIGNELVEVTITPFNDEGEPATICTTESFTISNNSTPTPPECTFLITPNNTEDVALDTNIEWSPIANADGYRITIGTSSEDTDILNNFDVGNVTNYDVLTDFTENTTIYITITPYNTAGIPTTCTEESFKTEIIPVVPICTNLIMPLHDAEDVPIDTDISWNAVPNVTGYLLKVGTTSGGIDVLNNIDLNFDVTSYTLPTNLDSNRLIFVTVTPYNEVGDAIDCSEESFETATFASSDLPTCTTIISPSNNATDIPVDISNITWSPVPNITGYRISITASSSTVNNITDIITTDTFYNFSNEFENSETISVTIIPFNTVGDANACTTIFSFTIEDPAPTVPSTCANLVSPANGSSNIPVDIANISWDAVDDVTGYRISITASSSIVNNITDIITTDTFYNFSNEFENSETISVTIIPFNAVGDANACTTIFSFTIEDPAPTVPSTCANLVSPVNGSSNIPVDIANISWDAVDDVTGYRISISASSTTANNITDIITTDTFYDFSNEFENSETISVTIIPFNAVGDANACTTIFSFTIEDPAPTVPSTCANLVSPANGSSNIPVDVANISWDAVDDVTGYRISITASSSIVNNITDIITTDTFYNFSNEFENSETISVTIIPFNAVGDANACTTVQSFTIEDPAPTVPSNCANLVSPANGSSNIPVDIANISWDAVDDVTGYRISITASSTTANNITDIITTDTFYNFSNEFENSETISVTIIPFNAVGDANACSTAQSFTIEDPAPTVPSTCANLVSPANGSSNIPVDIANISWDAVDDVTGYRISITASSTTANNITDIITTDTFYDFSNEFENSETISVTIIPFNAAGDANACSTAQSFTIEDPAPTVPSTCANLVSPANGSSNIPVDITNISWDAVDDTTGYRISIGSTSGGTDIVNNIDTGSLTSYDLDSDLLDGTSYYINITPYNAVGDAEACTENVFTTLTPPKNDVKYGFSPDGDGINDFWRIEGIESHPDNIVTIYNRWGDIVFQTQGYNNTSNVFYGVANRKTKMGANKLPEGTYFFNFTINGAHNFNKLQGFVVIKR